MATLQELSIHGGPLTRMGGQLRSGEQPERLMYASEQAIAWMTANLKNAVSDGYYGGARTPIQQAMDIVHSFVCGDELQGELEPHIMKPKEEGIWVIRTPDLRMYGWFWKPNMFILNRVDLKENVQGNPNAYNEHVTNCCEFRDEIDLDEPKTEFGDLLHVTGI